MQLPYPLHKQKLGPNQQPTITFSAATEASPLTKLTIFSIDHIKQVVHYSRELLVTGLRSSGSVITLRLHNFSLQLEKRQLIFESFLHQFFSLAYSLTALLSQKLFIFYSLNEYFNKSLSQICL